MKIIKKIKDFKKFRKKIVGTIGFVPTMGAIHDGHLSLITRAKKENGFVIVSIFINPTQFNDKNDFKNYPKTLSKDIKMLAIKKIDILFMPSYNELYQDNYRYRIIETDFSKKLCGRFRPGHFDGVLSVIMKLFNIIKPNKAYFGEKDFQQYALIKKMTDAFFLDIKIIVCPTIRESDGLAKSSRNLLLSKEERKKAPLIYKTIKRNISDYAVKKILEEKGFRVEYVSTISGRRFIAAKLGNMRLIDNIKIKRRRK